MKAIQKLCLSILISLLLIYTQISSTFAAHSTSSKESFVSSGEKEDVRRQTKTRIVEYFEENKIEGFNVESLMDYDPPGPDPRHDPPPPPPS
ncbi:uncharacterized protein LOC105155740 [Sesamum indicum]|uniref:Uncharacterized protein LOC105155740 n=1 Tax=Sesamum indicum TaxID=4182 RepID=A0A6I9SK33_SESIN|nr:uncharacterized protein LOC105155740 [Sesamum indicum]